MERRKFLQLTATGTGGLLLLPDFLTAQNIWETPLNVDNNILVFIQLNGGNDGLNTFIPYENPVYYSNRPSIGIPKDKVINAINGMGFHPALKDFAKILQDKNLSVVQNVGYPNPNRSHFRSQEIWQTASESDKYLDYGWLGRYLDMQYKDEIVSSLNIDNIDNLSLKTKNANVLTIKDFNKIKRYNNEENELTLSKNPQLDFVRKLQYASVEGMDEVKKALDKSKNNTPNYANNPLSKNLEWISKLIKGNLNSKVYYTSFSGFDTHNNQLTSHNKQLMVLNDAVFSFYNDMKNSNLINNVTLVVFSEFGRRLKENGSGTDHGTAGPMFIIGGKNQGKILDKNPDLNNLDKGDLIYDIDFRSVYASILKNKLNFDPKSINISQKALDGLF